MPLSTAAQNAALDALLLLANNGSASTPTIELGNSTFSSIYLTIPLDNDAFGDASGGSASATGTPISATGAVTGSATHMRLKDRDGNIVDGRNEAINAITALLNSGTGTAVAEWTNSDGSVVYLSQNLNNPAFANASAGTATANGLPKSAVGAANGTATHQYLKDRDGTLVDSYALSASLTVVSGRTYVTNSLTYSADVYAALLSAAISITSGNSYSVDTITATQPAS